MIRLLLILTALLAACSPAEEPLFAPDIDPGPSSTMKNALAIIGIVVSFFMIKYRERVGDLFGEADWMRKLGGVYNVVIIAAILIFFWCLATLTGTTDFFLKPLSLILPNFRDSNTL